MLAATVLALTVAAVADLRTRLIPDWVPAALVAWAVLATAMRWSSAGWAGLGAGLAMGFAVGIILFRAGGLGGGDAKLLGAAGAALGPKLFLAFLFYSAVAGGLLALVAVARGQRDLSYAPALALGSMALMLSRWLSW